MQIVRSRMIVSWRLPVQSDSSLTVAYMPHIVGYENSVVAGLSSEYVILGSILNDADCLLSENKPFNASSIKSIQL